MVEVTQETWSFDDAAIGKARNGNKSLQTRQIVRPSGMSIRDWYDHAAIVCAVLATANAEAAALREQIEEMEYRAKGNAEAAQYQIDLLNQVITERDAFRAQAATQEQRIAELEAYRKTACSILDERWTFDRIASIYERLRAALSEKTT